MSKKKILFPLLPICFFKNKCSIISPSTHSSGFFPSVCLSRTFYKFISHPKPAKCNIRRLLAWLNLTAKLILCLLAVNLCVELQDIFLAMWLPECQACPLLSSLTKKPHLCRVVQLLRTLKLHCDEP